MILSSGAAALYINILSSVRKEVVPYGAPDGLCWIIRQQVRDWLIGASPITRGAVEGHLKGLLFQHATQPYSLYWWPIDNAGCTGYQEARTYRLMAIDAVIRELQTEQQWSLFTGRAIHIEVINHKGASL